MIYERMMGGEHNHCCYREQLGYALYAKFREPKLFRMAVTGDWDLIPSRCRSHPKEATFIHKYPPADTALHRMLRPVMSSCSGTDEVQYDQQTLDKMNELRIRAVIALLDANRDAALVRDSFGRTPLHWACMNVVDSISGNAAIIIINANPTVVSVVDNENRSALHSLVARNNHIPVDVLLLLLERHPSAVVEKDIVGDNPIDIVERRGIEINNVDVVLKHLRSVSESLSP